MSTSEPSTSAPAPSQHIFLHELPSLKAGTKVRFLCCVLHYDNATGRLHVEHPYPADALQLPRAYVDVNLLVETLKPELIAKGAWLNILGYMLESEDGAKRLRRSTRSKRTNAATPSVQAVVVWSAGAIKVTEYEKTLEKHRKVLINAKQVVEKYA